jgi:formylglycine-generating enzyme required for sulfatase activity
MYITKNEITIEYFNNIMGYGIDREDEVYKPIANISWYDAVQFCNQASKIIGFKPYYNISEIEYYTDEEKIESIKSAKVTENKSANGYRLPTLEEWQYAAKGGSLSKNYTYSGSNDQDEVAWWYFKNKKRTIRNYCRRN